MFANFKIDKETDEMQSVRQAFDPVTARSSQHQACDYCHEKKIRCSGEKDGCERCLSMRRTCVYTRSGSKRSKKSGRPSPDGRRRGESSGSSSRGTAASGRGESSSSHSRRGASRHHGYPMATTAEDHANALSQLDDSMLGPELDLSQLLAGGDHSAGSYGVPTTSANGYHQPGAVQYSSWTTQPPYSTPGGSAATAADYYAAAGEDDYDYGEYDEYQNVDPRYWSQGR